MRNDSKMVEMASSEYTMLHDINPREELNFEELAEIIALRGDTTEIVIWGNRRIGDEWKDDPTYGQDIGMKGHRTTLALDHLKVEQRDVWDALFPNGKYPVQLFEGLSAEVESKYRNDHVAQQPIGSDYELFVTMENHIAMGMSPTQLAVEMTPIFRIKGKNSTNYKDSLKLSGAAAHAKLRSAWEGRIRIPRYVAKLGEEVRNLYVQTIRKDTDNPVPRMDNKRILELHSLFIKDRDAVKELIEGGHPMEPISCDNLGPLVKEQLAAYKVADENNEPPTRSARRSATEIKEYIPMVRYAGYKAIFTWLGGEEAPLKKYDDLGFRAEIVSTYFPEEWAELTDELYATGLKLRAEAKAAAEAEAQVKVEAEEAAKAQAAVDAKKTGKETKTQKSSSKK